MPVTTRGRKREPTNLAELHNAMDEEDEDLAVAEGAQKSARDQGADGSDSEDEDDYEQLVAEVKEAARDKQTVHNYWKSLERLVVFLFFKQTSKKSTADKYRILEPKLREALEKENALHGKDDKGKKKTTRLREVADGFLKRSSADYRPIDVEKLEAGVFLAFCMSLSDSKEGEFLKSYGGHRSALTYLFLKCQFAPSQQFHDAMKECMTGLKKRSAAARGEKGGKLSEGKLPLPFDVYKAICTWLIEEGTPDAVFAHCFLTMTWNLMCRSKNTVIVRLEHISWSDDAMTVQFAHNKNDMVGDNAGYERHVYTNAEVPEICAVTSFGCYRAICPGADTGRLFPGASQYDRFRKILARVVKEHASEVRRMGIDPNDIGVHSIRKGAATYACNGTTAGVSFAAVCVRAGWTMGGVKDRYLQHAPAGDQLCGRTVAGLDVNSHRFSISPPHFLIVDKEDDSSSEDSSIEGSDDDEKVVGCLDDKVDKAIETVFGQIPLRWQLLMRYVLASLLFHHDWLKLVVKDGTRLRGSVIFRRGIFDSVLPSVKTCFPWTNTNHPRWVLTFTGIPPMTMCFNYHMQALMELRAMPGLICAKIVEELDQREIGGGELTIARLKRELFDPYVKKIDERLSSFRGSSAAKPDDAEEGADKKCVSFDWGHGQFRSMPKDYRLNTKLTCQDAWLCWHIGEERKTADGKIEYRSPAWKSITSRDLPQNGTSKSSLSNLKLLCSRFDAAAGLTVHSKPTVKQLVALYKEEPIRAIMESVAMTRKGQERRVDQLHWETMARELRSADRAGKPKVPRRAARKAPTTTYKAPVPKRTQEVVDTRPPKKQKRKAAGQRDPVVVHRYATPGPVPNNDCGQLTIEPNDYRTVEEQGKMICGAVTTAYLNILARQHHLAGVRRVSDSFMVQLELSRSQFGSVGGWDHYTASRHDDSFGDHLIDWAHDKLIILQIFRGPRETGHFALLIVDRTILEEGILVFFDSLPDCFPDTLDMLKEMLAGSQLAPEGCKWIRGSMPRQGIGTNDCGVFMLCGAALYIKGLIDQNLLSSEEPASGGEVFDGVSINPAVDDTRVIGAAGRKHICDTLKSGACSFDDSFFHLSTIRWGHDV